jgi:heme a synthase
VSALQKLIWFRRLALAGAILATAVVILGAWVRLTNAGLGCPDWPGCYGHLHPAAAAEHLDTAMASFPHRPFDYSKALHEMVHRYFATSLGLVILALCILAWLNRRDAAMPRNICIALFTLVCVQGALGAFTVTLLLKPLIVTLHLLGGLSTMALLWWVSSWPSRRPSTAAEMRLRPLALVALAVLAVQIALGGWTSANYAAVACPDFPTCQRSFWPPMALREGFVLWRGLGIDYEGGVLNHPARVAIHFMHRIGAIVAATTLLFVAAMAWWRAGSRLLRARGALLACAVALQVGIGIAMVLRGFPLWLATLHNAGAAFVVICLILLIRDLWPAASVRLA